MGNICHGPTRKEINVNKKKYHSVMSKLSGELAWDSDFFKKRIAYIDGIRANPKQIQEEINRLLYKGVDCIYLYSLHPIELNGYNAILVDRKRTYTLDRPEYKDLDDYEYQTNLKFDGKPAELYDLALQSGEYSRFNIDPNFTDADFTRLYYRWVDNSLLSEFADFVIVLKDQNPIGFITAKIKGDYISIGLLATDVHHRGKGIASYLMQRIKNEASVRGQKIEVVTQGDNHVACNFYERMGFSVKDELYVYHIWNKDKTKNTQ